MNRKIFRYILLIYALGIFIESSLPGDNFPKIDLTLADKYAHFIIYFGLCLLFFYSLKNQSKFIKLRQYPLFFSFVFTSLYGVTDEVHQMFTPYRSSDILDWLADTLGALLCIIFIKIFYKKLPFLNTNKPQTI
ncbi:MAG: VanZ family protein [Ignavibacteria bacterium]|nr:VanZ family protein [Ignavibacteria bacterium]